MLAAAVSAKGAPGVTTVALSLAAASGIEAPALMVEADPSGGDLDCWFGPLGEPGLLGLAADLAHEVDPALVWKHAVEVAPGVRAVVSPTTEAATCAALAATSDVLGPALASLDDAVLLDAGRWSRSQLGADRVAAAGVVVVVCSPTLAGIEHARGLIGRLRPVNGRVAVVLSGGSRPYGPAEVAESLAVPVIGVFPWDPRGFASLVSGGAGRSWRRSELCAAARETAGTLAEILAEGWSRA